MCFESLPNEKFIGIIVKPNLPPSFANKNVCMCSKFAFWNISQVSAIHSGEWGIHSIAFNLIGVTHFHTDGISSKNLFGSIWLKWNSVNKLNRNELKAHEFER